MFERRQLFKTDTFQNGYISIQTRGKRLEEERTSEGVGGDFSTEQGYELSFGRRRTDCRGKKETLLLCDRPYVFW